MLHAIEINVSLNMVFFSVDAFSGTQTRERVSLPELQRSVVLHGREQRYGCCCHGDAHLPHTHPRSLRDDGQMFHTTSVEDAGLVILKIPFFEGQTLSKIKGVGKPQC